MREIKFRAWLPSIKYMTYNHPLEELMGWNLNITDSETPIWLQYTGLKDKNGEEIYEGDIVLCKIHDKEYMGLVEYTNTYGFYYLSGMGRSDTELWGCNERKVIGNIYENPEMLT